MSEETKIVDTTGTSVRSIASSMYDLSEELLNKMLGSSEQVIDGVKVELIREGSVGDVFENILYTGKNIQNIVLTHSVDNKGEIAVMVLKNDHTATLYFRAGLKTKTQKDAEVTTAFFKYLISEYKDKCSLSLTGVSAKMDDDEIKRAMMRHNWLLFPDMLRKMLNRVNSNGALCADAFLKEIIDMDESEYKKYLSSIMPKEVWED